MDKAVPLVKKMVQRLEEGLDAKETKFFAHEGKVQDQRNVVDHGTRAGAIKQTMELFDILRSRSDAEGGGRPVIVNIKWPAWAAPPKGTVVGDGDTLEVK